MNVPHEPTRCSLWLSPSPSDPLALVSTSELSPPSMEGFLPLGIMEHPPELRTAPTPRVRSVSVRFMLKPMSSPTQRDTEFHSQVLRFMQQIPPAIRVPVYSSMLEYLPWFLCENIETKVVSDY